MRHEDLNGAILGTGSRIKIDKISLELSYHDAYALCNLLCKEDLKENKFGLESKQVDALLRIGRDLGIFVDHHSKHNLGKMTFFIEDAK